MSESKAKVSPDRQTASANGRRFSDDFKRDAVRLVVDEQYTFKAAAKAVGVSEKSLRDWHKRFALPANPLRHQPRASAKRKKARSVVAHA